MDKQKGVHEKHRGQILLFLVLLTAILSTLTRSPYFEELFISNPVVSQKASDDAFGDAFEESTFNSTIGWQWSSCQAVI